MNRPLNSKFKNTLISCEHASNKFPVEFRRFIGDLPAFDKLLETHRGYDAGALDLAEDIAELCKSKVYAGKVSRLLVDLNRSSWNKNLHFKDLRTIPDKDLTRILNAYYDPHRKAVHSELSKIIKKHGFSLHVSVHSFTPVLNGKHRKCDIGILFNPKRKNELIGAKKLRSILRSSNPNLKIWFNHPYRGTSDGLTTWLRNAFSDRTYAGVEIELNQKLLTQKSWPATKSNLAAAIAEFLGEALP